MTPDGPRDEQELVNAMYFFWEEYQEGHPDWPLAEAATAATALHLQLLVALADRAGMDTGQRERFLQQAVDHLAQSIRPVPAPRPPSRGRPSPRPS